MSGIYIHGLEMPKSCAECLDVGWHYVFECNLDDVEHGERNTDCPLVPVPDHGRLIEERHAIRAFYDTYKEYGLPWRNAEVVFEVCPTILPADKEAGG